ncbi:hypothetical protein ACP70R_041326 [Stipagrostis hirtigluma subsp. patula]
MGRPEVMKVLFETPSGFAFFNFDGEVLDNFEDIWTNFVSKTTTSLVIWLMDFQKFENTSDAINPVSGIDERLTKMIKKCWFGERLVVGKPMHKEVIEKKLGITCLYNEAVLEVMRGLKFVLHTVVPREESELSEEDSKDRCRGLHMFLLRHGLNINPELINVQIAEAACFVYHCSEMDKEILESLNYCNYLEREGINTLGWDALKSVTGLVLMCTNEPLCGPDQEFSEEEMEKINGGKGKYDKHIIMDVFMGMYKRAVEIHEAKARKLKELENLVKEANESSEKLLDEPEGTIAKKRKISCQEDEEAAEGEVVVGQEVGVDADNYAVHNDGATEETVKHKDGT